MKTVGGAPLFGARRDCGAARLGGAPLFGARRGCGAAVETGSAAHHSSGPADQEKFAALTLRAVDVSLAALSRGGIRKAFLVALA